MLLSGLAMTVALGCVGRGANEANQNVALSEVATPLGADQSGLGLWAAYGTFDGQHVALAVSTVIAEPVVSDPSVQLQPARLPVRTEDLQPRGDWRALVQQYDDWNVDTMMRILGCESTYGTNNYSRDGRNIGPWQLNVVHGFSMAGMLDPVRSTELAHEVFLSQGYGAWSCY